LSPAAQHPLAAFFRAKKGIACARRDITFSSAALAASFR
jgi:hypothetical protein